MVSHRVPLTDICRAALRLSLDGLFRPVERAGFWSEEDGRLVPRLDVEERPGGLAWRPNLVDNHRYGPVALMGATTWRASALGEGSLDAKIQRNLDHYGRLAADPAVRDALPSYGAGALIAAFARAEETWPGRGYDAAAEDLSEFALRRYRFRFNEDALVLMGVAARGERAPAEHRALLAARADSMRAAQDRRGLYRRQDQPSSFRHQNQMYTIWGLAHADLALGRTDSAASIRRCLEYTVARRLRPDGALLWHAYRGPAHRLYALTRGALDRGYMPEHRCLFSCHQAFFVYAAQAYRALTGDGSFDEPAARAMRWVFGGNALGRSMFDLTGTGLPWRVMTTAGSTLVPRHRFIKAYEIGAMIMALVSLLEGVAPADRGEAIVARTGDHGRALPPRHRAARALPGRSREAVPVEPPADR